MITEDFLKASIRTIPDFPAPGIQFKDITTLLKRPELFRHIVETAVRYYSDKGITRTVAIESRGFIMGGALAASTRDRIRTGAEAGEIAGGGIQKELRPGIRRRRG